MIQFVSRGGFKVIHTWAENISSFFIDKSVISENDRKVYNYCFELLISESINILIVLVVSNM